MLADCPPELIGMTQVTTELESLLPTDQRTCGRAFTERVMHNAEDADFCGCFTPRNDMDRLAASANGSEEEKRRFDNILGEILEKMVLSNFKETLESTFNNTIYFDAYVKRDALDSRFLANMDQCRLQGIMHEFFTPPKDCDQQIYIRRLTRILSKSETDVRTALSLESTKKTLEEDFIKAFQKEAIPLAKNLKHPKVANACLPYKAYMMIAAPPIDHDDLFLDTIKFGGMGKDEDFEAKKMLLMSYLHYNDRPAQLNSDMPHPLDRVLKEGKNIERMREIASNDPVMLLAFGDPKIIERYMQIREYRDELRNKYQAARNAVVTPQYNAKRDELQRACAPKDRACMSTARDQAHKLTDPLFPGEEAWRIAQNLPAPEEEEDFFHKETTINEVIKAQNKKCEDLGKKMRTDFLCKKDLGTLREEVVDWELAPKIYAQYPTEAPRILNHYLKKNYCTVQSDKSVGPREEITYTSLSDSVLDPMRPRSDLTDLNEDRLSDYERYNNFLCAKLNARRPDGTTFSCTETPVPSECENPLYLKHMACTALKSEMASAHPPITAYDQQDLLQNPGDNGSANMKKLPVAKEHPDQAAMLLEFERLTNTLPGELGNNCALPANPTTNVASANLGWANGEFSAGSGGASHNEALFGDYFLAGTDEDQQHLQEFKQANPNITSGTAALTMPPLPYERRVTITAPPPVVVTVPVAVTPTPAPDVINDPTIAKATGSFAERGLTYRTPASLSPAPASNAGDVPLVGPTPAPSATAGPIASNDQDENLRRLREMERQLKELER
ncbi:MAG: hypothetical protein AABY86_02375, partial [Bdellovibrionota bacterium]